MPKKKITKAELIAEMLKALKSAEAQNRIVYKRYPLLEDLTVNRAIVNAIAKAEENLK